MDEIEIKIKNIISKQLGIKVDSLDTVEMLLTIEDEFGIEVTEEVAESVETVQMVIDFVKSLQTTN